MKQIILAITFFFALTSCSSARNERTKENIRKEYSFTDNKKKKSSKKARNTTAKKSYSSKTAVPKKTASSKAISTSNNNIQREVLIATSSVTVSGDAIQNYINLYKDAAMESMRIYGVPASIKLAQGILESGSGKGTLCREANNHFGIKCKDEWTGETIFHTDDAPDECFRKYSSPLDSYNDHSLFLANRVYYKNLFLLEPYDYVSWANGLRKAGYATDPKYPQKLISLIERYQLYQYDELVLGDNYQAVAKPVVTSKILDSEIYTVGSGDTLFAIANRFDVPIDEIKRLNNLHSNTLKVGQTLKIK